MASVLTFLLGLIAAALGWLLAEFVGRPFRQFFDLRREVKGALVRFANARAQLKTLEAQETFRRLGSEMRAFAKAEFFANRVVGWLGYDANEISKALIEYSNEVFTDDDGRAAARVEKLLRIGARTRMANRRLQSLGTPRRIKQTPPIRFDTSAKTLCKRNDAVCAGLTP
jgi:hypothetical protein